MFIDIHSHILPDIDDGPKTATQSLELLECAVKNGIDRIVATPHFYASIHSLEQHTAKAKERFLELDSLIKENKLPLSILLGYEVRYFDGISRIDSLDRLCINGTKVILLELGSIPFTSDVIDEIMDLNYYGYTVVLAHIERYTKMRGFSSIKQLVVSNVVYAQCNASSLLKGPFRRVANGLLKEGVVSAVASDMHSVEERPPQIKEAMIKIEEKFGVYKINKLLRKTEKLYELMIH